MDTRLQRLVKTVRAAWAGPKIPDEEGESRQPRSARAVERSVFMSCPTVTATGQSNLNISVVTWHGVAGMMYFMHSFRSVTPAPASPEHVQPAVDDRQQEQPVAPPSRASGGNQPLFDALLMAATGVFFKPVSCLIWES